MPASVAVMLVLGVLVHGLLGRWMASPWWTPDVTTISLVMALAYGPSRVRRARAEASGWTADERFELLAPGLLAGCLVMVLSVRDSVLLGLSYLGLGWLIGSAASEWDLTDRTVQRVALGAAETVLLCVALVTGGALSAGLVGLAACKLLVTMACLTPCRRLAMWIIRPAVASQS